MISVIVPTLNEAVRIRSTLAPLQPLRGHLLEVIVVDGGSEDDTATLARPLSDRLLVTASGRARQMNAGAAVASGETLLFLHADTILPMAAVERLAAISRSRGPSPSSPYWGRFDVAPDAPNFGFRMVAWFMNRRSRLSGIATGDQAIFAEKNLFQAVGGFPDIPLMEDIALSKRLRRRQRPLCLRPPVTISMRYWERHGLWRSILRMWALRLAYFFNVPPDRLHRRYYREN